MTDTTLKDEAIWKEEEKVIKCRIKELENKINDLCERDEFNDKSHEKLVDELRELDPYNDMFHLGCRNWPNCDTEGCGVW